MIATLRQRFGAAGTPVSRPQSSFVIWVRATGLAAITVTCLDALLLQKKKSFFTGGFLAATHAETLPQAAGFLTASLIVDASVLGLLAAMILWVTARIRLTVLARFALVVLGSLAPILIWNVVAYSLLTYLGDAFDLGLMFDLTGRNAGEVLAVAGSHLVAPTLMAVVIFAGVGAMTWVINRSGHAAGRGRAPVPRRLILGAAVCFFFGLVTCTALSSTSDVAEDGLRRKASGQLFTWAASELTDFDRDGFGIGGRNSDPGPFNASIYPYAIDVPGNGIDENGVGGDLPSAEPSYSEVTPPATTWVRKPNVVFVVLESFRADAVGRFVNGAAVTPALDALVRDGAATAVAYSHNGYTTQSRYHLFTGSLAGLRRDGSIIDDFKAQGYQVAYFSAQDESFGGRSLSVGFERAEVAYDARQDRDRRYSTFTTAGSLAVSHQVLRQRIAQFLERRDRSRPLFLYVNFHDAHFPYHHQEMEPIVSKVRVAQSKIAPSRRKDVQEMYYNAAANVDRALAATLAQVTDALGARPGIIVTADHGESLFDEGFLGHGYALNDAQTRIPLVVKDLPLEIRQPFGQADLRNALAQAMAAPDGAPALLEDENKVVFQYLGSIHRPRQIAFAGKHGRLVYDFRDKVVQFPNGRRIRGNALAGDDATQVQRLVHLWERMMLARAAEGVVKDDD